MKRTQTAYHAWASIALALALSLATGACAQKDADSPDADSIVERVASQGESTLTFSVPDDDPVFTDGLVLTVQASAPAGMSATLADYATLLRESELGFELRIVNTKRTAPPSDATGPRLWTDRYEIEFVLPGEYELPPAMAAFESDPSAAAARSTQTADDGQPSPAKATKPLELTTEGIHILARDPQQVQLTEAQWSEIKTIAPYELPPPWSRWWWAAGGLFALALAVFFFRGKIARFFARRREQRARAVIVIPADVWARRLIEALIAENLLERGAGQEFHYRVSYILRGYIERRFEVSAGEMTTEEFLEAIVSDRRFGADVTTELEPFMIACDLVKYARHQPTPEESMTALRATEAFVERTKPVDFASPAESAVVPSDREYAA